jgi:hypothetical protein
MANHMLISCWYYCSLFVLCCLISSTLNCFCLIYLTQNTVDVQLFLRLQRVHHTSYGNLVDMATGLWLSHTISHVTVRLRSSDFTQQSYQTLSSPCVLEGLPNLLSSVHNHPIKVSYPGTPLPTYTASWILLATAVNTARLTDTNITLGTTMTVGANVGIRQSRWTNKTAKSSTATFAHSKTNS